MEITPSLVSGPPSMQQTPAPAVPTVEPVVAEGVPTVQVPINAAPSKLASQSLTIKFNGALIVLSFILTVLVPFQPQLMDAIRTAVPNPEVGTALVGAFGAMIALANVLIRVYKTTQPIAH